MLSLGLLIFLSVAALWLLVKLKRTSLHKWLSSIPRPSPKENVSFVERALRVFVGDLLDYNKSRHQYILESHQNFGDLIRIQRGTKHVVFCADADMVKTILTSKKFIKSVDAWGDSISLSSLLYKVRWNDVANLIQPFVGNTFFTMDGPEWKHTRTTLNPLFSSRFVECLTGSLITSSFTIIDKWAKEFAMNQDFVADIVNDVHEVTLEAIVEVATGLSLPELDKLKSGIGSNLQHAFRGSLTAFISKYEKDASLKASFLPFMADPSVSPHLKQILLRAQEASKAVVEAHTQGKGSDRRNMISLMYDAGFPLETIVYTVTNMIVAGAESNAVGVSMCLYEITQHAEYFQRAQREVDEIIGQGKPTVEKLKNLNFIDCCYKEALRIFPPATIVHRVASEDTQLGEQMIPKGTTMGVCIYALHHSSKYWPEPERFDPDRFTPEESAKRPYYAFLPFSHGSRGCPGLRLSHWEAKVIISMILQQFTLFTEKPIDKMLPKFVSWPVGGVRLRVRPRENLACAAG